MAIGYATLDVDRAELIRLMSPCFRLLTKIRYSLGAKPRMGAVPGVGFKKADCSGFIRWLINGATFGKDADMPDGSWFQHKWAKERFREVPYAECARMDSKLRIAFIPTKNGRVGHVWLCVNGRTIESYGGHGAGRRPWNTPVLLNQVTACYVLTDPLK
jgi:cell wall-associated NlpC family hydrolase